jgi:hypothetical protein
MADTNVEPEIAAARAAVLAEIDAGGGVAPGTRPLTINAGQPLNQVSAPLASKLEARVSAGYQPEGDDYPSSRTWSRVVVPAIAVAAVDVPVVIITGILAAFHVELTVWLFIASLLLLIGASAVAIAASISPLRDPLRLTTGDRRELNLSRSWQSRQPWMGPRSTTPEYRLFGVAHRIVTRLAASPAWASRYLDEHRLRLNLAAELDGIDHQACQLAVLREAHGSETDLGLAWSALLDRVARLRNYADGVHALDGHVIALDAAARTQRLDEQLGQLAVGSALDQFAAEHVRTLTADLQRVTATSFGSSPGSAT